MSEKKPLRIGVDSGDRPTHIRVLVKKSSNDFVKLKPIYSIKKVTESLNRFSENAKFAAGAMTQFSWLIPAAAKAAERNAEAKCQRQRK